ncbi:MAG TPA: type 1 glutamine amidotransferase [Planctomycetota bacterium]|nr:type 1 glutamine amidotransferase [Planctomycetota bacterium]
MPSRPSRPVIGLTAKLISEGTDTFYKLDRNYVDAVVAAGGEPLILPFVKSEEEAARWLDRVRGVLFTGGPDINPVRWSEPLHPKASLMHSDKEASDFHFAAEALRRDAPILAICLGCQEINVALGGSLHQHIEGHEGGKEHGVEVLKSRLRDLVGSAPSVNSYHHQAINRLGAGLKATARAPDGTIEGLESSRHRFVVGVQWHPERIADRPEQQKLFRTFVAETAR